MYSLLMLVHTVLNIVVYLVLASAILSWLVAFGIVNLHNPFMRQVYDFLYRVTEPLLAPIRRVIPTLGGIDLSPIVLLLGIMFLQNLLRYDVPRWFGLVAVG